MAFFKPFYGIFLFIHETMILLNRLTLFAPSLNKRQDIAIEAEASTDRYSVLRNYHDVESHW
ncbi:hypothetical protein LWC05_00935 [Acetobacter sicerae]|uniref:Uncharacterized protein n=1 Tax=Acetobacter sicerae TaxID=85325 RepID=A0ABS8VSJ6_9PROT|nr:hypothetical protein [Acetobacter sicerae]MCE0742464.1 hypothetical protein [Acetobacter sicerae]